MAWSGQYTGHNGSPTIIFKAVADYDLWIWNTYFGMPGTNNDIIVLDSSNLFSNLAEGYYCTNNPTTTRINTFLGKKHVLHDIMTACIIMHNMIIEDERDLYAPIQEVRETPTREVDIVVDETTRFNQFIARYRQIKDKDAHIALHNALIDHLWEEYTNSDS
ncbi:uncharacterized protein LOC109839168 [Asparagus officinalis]|uniref:uncharacterized protein LOC109839168 n=1 Tax=Asparagus officinalis TaxID=4686 RepID=UPI00098E0005|nr:uncharacterized protein LOC109839168 [Asparagus officinalis]